MSLTRSLTGKISIGYIAIAVVSFLAFSICLITLNKNKQIDKEISEVSVPNLIQFKDMNMMNAELKRLSNSWIYTSNDVDKKRLTDLVVNKYPEVKKKLSGSENSSSDEATKAEIKKLISKFDTIVASCQQITQILKTDEDYGNDIKVDEAMKLNKDILTPAIEETNHILNSSIKNYTNKLNVMQIEKDNSYFIFNITLICVILVIIGTGAASLLISRKIIINPVKELKDAINTLSKGEIPEVQESSVSDEIGEMRSSLRSMITGFKGNMDFAIEIGKGNYSVEFMPLSEKDQMRNALLEMRKNLKFNAEEDDKRNWATLGLAKIGEVLRSTDKSSDQLYDSILAYLVKYINANQGGLFIVESDDDRQKFLELKSCYAYSRKKFLEKKINIGSGLIGQCYLEGETIHMTEIPSSYVEITSGLGEATPTSIIIVPLKINKNIFGILELASFNHFEKFQIEFLEKIGESIASMISNIKISEETKYLLQQSQQQAEELRSQEEEMRQNMEELTATQEEMHRKEQEYINKIERLEKQIHNLQNNAL